MNNYLALFQFSSDLEIVSLTQQENENYADEYLVVLFQEESSEVPLLILEIFCRYHIDFWSCKRFLEKLPNLMLNLIYETYSKPRTMCTSVYPVHRWKQTKNRKNQKKKKEKKKTEKEKVCKLLQTMRSLLQDRGGNNHSLHYTKKIKIKIKMRGSMKNGLVQRS